MSERKHEPGPWILGGMSGRMITTPSGYVGDGFIADVDTLANARLIAAAPDLLDAAVAAVDQLSGSSAELEGADPRAFYGRIAEALFLLRAAIARAEGSSQP